MRREEALEDFTDGKLYTSNDLVKAGCGDCAGCHHCCEVVGDTIILDPKDIYELSRGTRLSFTELLNGKIAMGMVDGVILPHMDIDKSRGGCSFLSEDGRCTVHLYRPGICRLFPLGRYYENGSFKYILQTNQCIKNNMTKVKIKKFLGIENLTKYEAFVNEWHYLLKDVEKKIVMLLSENKEEESKKLTMLLLNAFYINPYEKEDFYAEVKERMDSFKRAL